jgi:hypothetical protein
MTKKFTLITSPDEAARAAARRSSLADEVLVFVYPVRSRRVFSTFASPALRIVAIDDKKHVALFDQVVQPSRFIVLPASRLVLEMQPGVEYADLLPTILDRIAGKAARPTAEVEQEVSASPLIFALFADALADLRRVKSVCLVAGEIDQQKLRARFAAWERGKILGSAGFVIDYSGAVTWRIPVGAIELSHEVLDLEKDYHEELLAASIAGVPWQKQLSNKCLRCGRGGSWRQALPVPEGMPDEISWRLERPENAVALCHDCVDTVRYSTDQSIRRELAWGVWGPRFEALERWYLATMNLKGYGLPKDWSREEHPLWPKEFGGRDWASGSGEAKNCTVREPHSIRRTQKQQRILDAAGIGV